MVNTRKEEENEDFELESAAVEASTDEVETSMDDVDDTINSQTLANAIQINSSPKVDEFNWEEFETEAGKSKYSTSARNAMEQMYEQTLSDLKEKEVIQGKIVAITDKDVVLNIGFKSDGLVPLSEFKYNPDIQVGDEVDIIVETREDKNGQVVISHRKALAESAWDKIMDAYENDKIVKGYIKDRTKGGMVVDLLGLDAFLPGSQLDVKPIKDYDSYVGTSMELKVVKLNPAFRNIVVSHKAIIESDLEQQKSEILGKLEKGQILEGIVKNLTSFGVFVDLGGVDGLIHITDVSWGRINHPEEVLELGQKINVVVLDYDEEKKRISLGMKQLTPHPWETLPADIEEGSVVKGKVVNLEDYGAFIEIFPGVEGLVHVSEMSWSTHLKSPQEYVKMNDEVEAKVLSIDREERKLSLGLKQLSQDPWADIEERFPVGSRHEGTIRSMTNFGLFMELEEGIDGLVHISDLSWTKKFSHPAEFTKVGEKLEVVVLDVDKENRRLSLGHKQLEEDPWDTFESIFLEGSVHQGVILSIEEKGATVGLPYGVEAFAPKKHLLKADKTKPKADETFDFRVIEFDKQNRKIILSHTDIWKDEERARKDNETSDRKVQEEKTRQEVKKVKSNVEKTTLADELDILQQLKNQMEEQDKAKQKEAMAKMDAREGDKEENTEDDSAEEVETTENEVSTEATATNDTEENTEDSNESEGSEESEDTEEKA